MWVMKNTDKAVTGGGKASRGKFEREKPAKLYRSQNEAEERARERMEYRNKLRADLDEVKTGKLTKQD